VQANIEEDYAAISSPPQASSHQGSPVLPTRARSSPAGEDRSDSPLSLSSRETSIPGMRMGISIEAVTEGRPIAECLPITVFNLVVSTQSTLLLSGDDLLPTSSSPFARDPYFLSNHPKSLLCAPIKQQSKLVAVLYLVNEFFSDAFSPSHLRVCEIVCTQAALSISNARLYSALESQARVLEATVAERTCELEEKNAWLEAEISERQLAQEAMRKAKEDAEAATKSKSDFLSNMSHEIRTPMNAVLGLSRLLADTELSAEQSQYLSMITSSGELLLSIINDILDVSHRTHTADLPLPHSPAPLPRPLTWAVWPWLCVRVCSGVRLIVRSWSWRVASSASSTVWRTLCSCAMTWQGRRGWT
jgi:signal transduction histidine kinase